MRARLLTLMIGCSFAASCMKGPVLNDTARKQEIRALLERWTKAFEARDLNGVMSIYAPGNTLIAYDVVAPLQYQGADAYRKDYAEFFQQFSGPLQVEQRDDHIDASGDMAVAYGLERMTGRLKNGTPVDVWMRYTDQLKRIDGQWLVVHEHISVPVDFATGKARLDLKP